MAGPVQPLLPQINTPEENAELLKKTAAILALLTAARLAPQTSAPILRFGFGVKISETTGSVTGFTPLVLTNAAPFPFGFFPSGVYGLKPNYYLPTGSGSGLPGFLPGVPEQRAEDAAKNPPPTLSQLTTPQQVTNFLNAFGSESLSEKLAGAQAGTFNLGTLSPADTARLIAAELARREEQRVASNRALGFDAEGKPLNPGQLTPSVPQPQRAGLNTLDFAAAVAYQILGPQLQLPQLTTEKFADAFASAILKAQNQAQAAGANPANVLDFAAGIAYKVIGPQFQLPPAVTEKIADVLAAAALASLNAAPPTRPNVSPSPGAPTAPGAPGGPALGPTIPGPPIGSPTSPSPQAPIPGLPVGPLVPPVENTPGSTPGQPRWPPRWPTPGQPFPDKFMEVAHGDP